jgi:hypothetical protein
MVRSLAIDFGYCRDDVTYLKLRDLHQLEELIFVAARRQAPRLPRGKFRIGLKDLDLPTRQPSDLNSTGARSSCFKLLFDDVSNGYNGLLAKASEAIRVAELPKPYPRITLADYEYVPSDSRMRWTMLYQDRRWLSEDEGGNSKTRR